MSDSRIKGFETNGALVEKFLKQMRGGLVAGNKDTKMVGDISAH